MSLRHFTDLSDHVGAADLRDMLDDAAARKRRLKAGAAVASRSKARCWR